MGYVISFLCGFSLGAIPFGFLVSKLRGVNIQRVGSGNIGFSNVFRSVGKVEGITVLFFDVAKGLVPVLVFKMIFGYHYALVAGIAAMLGHMFTPFLKCKGGKGVATGLGIFIGLAPFSALFAFVVWLIIVSVSRYISLGSLAAAVALPFFIYFSKFVVRDEYDFFLELFTILMSILVMVLHRLNIRRLFTGKERKFSFGEEEILTRKEGKTAKKS